MGAVDLSTIEDCCWNNVKPKLAGCRQIRNMLNQSGASHIGIIADIAHSKAFGDIDHILKEADGILFQVNCSVISTGGRHFILHFGTVKSKACFP